MTPVSPAPVDLLVDWDLAARTAAVVGRPGPQLPPEQAAEVVAELRTASAAAAGHVAGLTGLVVPPGPVVLVVDRAGWARANAAAFRSVLAPVVAEVFERRGRLPSSTLSAVGSRITGAELGSLLGVLSSRVLGQYDPFSGDAASDSGRLLLVAPNVVHVEGELGVRPHDFRLWVCLHEETHRVQFTATTWLAEHLIDQVRTLVGDLMLEPAQLADRLAEALRSVPDLLRGGSTAPLLEAIQTPQQRRRLARLTAVMSLLEGHADVVMDLAGPQVVPSVAMIRQRFDARRASRGVIDQILRRLLGLEAKMRQYADGARFVRGVLAEVGMEGFNAVWTSPNTLPQPEEITDPVAWVRRVHR
ncbi:MAG TPA: zinc-dependent metalloprotease [Kineosporiaceae bacterium]